MADKTLIEQAEDNLFRATQTCDSWGEVEDVVPDKQYGRYGVTVFFDAPEQAAAFRDAVQTVTLF